MLTHKGIDTNLCFLILEARKQVQQTQRFLQGPSDELIQSILSRDDYIDNLRSIIQRKCFAQAATLRKGDDPGVDLLKAFDVISLNLERIADFCEDIVEQARHIEDKGVLRAQEFGPFFEEVIAGLDRIDGALFHRNVQVALQICRAEHNLDRLYASRLQASIEELGATPNAHAVVTLVFIYHYFERMGDALLNIGEAVISACLGERIKISRFWALEDSLDRVQVGGGKNGVSLKPMADTRSGSRISRVQGSADHGRSLILKEGRMQKLLEEKRNIERWNEIMPGLAPAIHSFHQYQDSGATLFEYLPGRTFEELLLAGEQREVEEALGAICATLEVLWERTRTDIPAAPRFVQQLTRRLPDIYAVHPDFSTSGQLIGSVAVQSFQGLLAQAGRLDDVLVAPFSVFIHGDFNVDNVIYDAGPGQVRFIDLHRSTQTDYVQDLSVFLVSNYRLQALENPMRARLNLVMKRFYEFAAGFARRVSDEAFDARLTLGLARSFATSTRFVLAPQMAKSMFLRARYLIEHLVGLDRAALADVHTPLEVLLD